MTNVGIYIEGGELTELFRQILQKLDHISHRENDIMSTLNTGLTALQTAMAALVSENAQIVADVQKLLAGAAPGLKPGQVIVNQADIDALTSTVSGLTAADTAEDLLVNPPPPPPPTIARWIAGHVYATGDTATDSNGNIETATTGGTSGATEPVWPVLVGANINDGVAPTAVIWTLTSLVPVTVAAAKVAKPPFTPASATVDPKTGEVTHR